MKKIFAICLVGIFTLTAVSCTDKEEGNDRNGTITLNGTSQKIRSVFFTQEEADAFDEGLLAVALFRQKYDFTSTSDVPSSAFDFYIGLSVSDSYIDKEIDLTRLLTATGELSPGVSISLPDKLLEISDKYMDIYLNDGDGLSDITVTAGKLKVTRNGKNLAAQLSVKFSDGTSAAANWSGNAIELADN